LVIRLDLTKPDQSYPSIFDLSNLNLIFSEVKLFLG